MNIVRGQGVPDSIYIDDITEKSFMNNLSVRYRKKQIYTFIGEQLIAVNPYEEIASLYNDETLMSYKNSLPEEVQPHIFVLADLTYRQLIHDRENQCVIITGESGAGKTHTAKIFIQYITHPGISVMSENSLEGIKEKLMSSDLVLTAFGNAKTSLNENASRFGKYLEIGYDAVGGPLGARVLPFRLETSRVVARPENERSFHIFYMMMTQENIIDDLRLDSDITKYAYLQKGCKILNSMDDSKEFSKLSQAMDTLGFETSTQITIWKLLASILLLGNINYEPVKIGLVEGSQIQGRTEVQEVSLLLKILEPDLTAALTSRIISSGLSRKRSSNIQIPLSVTKAQNARDIFCTALYKRVFDLVIEKVNAGIGKKVQMKSTAILGVLDIHGSEIFDENFFEQFCINYCDEKIQQVYIDFVLKEEQSKIQNEGIDWTEIKYFDNAPIVSLIEAVPTGIFTLLDDVCDYNDVESKIIIEALDKVFGSSGECPHKNYDSENRNPDSFRILHSVGPVDYNVEDFAVRNNDEIWDSFKNLLIGSRDSVIANLYKKKIKEI